MESGDRSGDASNVDIRDRQKYSRATTAPGDGTKPWIYTSVKVSMLFSPLCGLLPTDKTEIPARDINHSMTHLTHRPFSTAEHPIIRLNAASSYEASESNG